MRKLVSHLGTSDAAPTFLFCDNKGAIALTKNNRFHKRTKRIDLRYFFSREKEADGTMRTAKVPAFYNLADTMAKVPSLQNNGGCPVPTESLYTEWAMPLVSDTPEWLLVPPATRDPR